MSFRPEGHLCGSSSPEAKGGEADTCVCICVYILIFTYIHLYIYIHACTGVFICMCIYLQTLEPNINRVVLENPVPRCKTRFCINRDFMEMQESRVDINGAVMGMKEAPKLAA